jgi:N-acyl-D-aspartate/D-glutamate deacylase
MAENMRRRGGAASLLITDDSRADLVGKTLADIAREKGKDPVPAAIDIILSGGASVASFNMNERDIANFMKQEFVMTGSDGSEGHPRKYGTYPRKFSHYVFGRPANGGRDSATVSGSRVIPLEVAVQRSSALPAMTFALNERGLLRAGYFADVVVIDTAKYAEQATYREPERLASGVRYVWVNGTLAVEDGRMTDALPGRGLRRGSRGKP